MLVSHVDSYDFRNALDEYFSYEACEVLFDFYDDYEGDEGYTFFDPVAIRCDWSEYESLEDAVLSNYGADYNPNGLNLEDLSQHTQEELEEALSDIGMVMVCPNGHVLLMG